MLLKEPLAFAVEFIRSVNRHIESGEPGRKISKTQCYWLALCISAIIITNSVCWARFEKISIGKFKLSSLSWMFRRGKICWEGLLMAGVKVILEKYGITNGVLVLDDSDRPRSKNTRHLAHVHKQKDKKTNGYVMGQNLVFLLFVTPKVTIPVGFAFYHPDPAKKAWQVEDARLKRLGIKKRNRPVEPDKNPDYPTKRELGLRLLRQFKQSFEAINIQCILADAFYSDGAFMDEASNTFNGVQVISQLRHNQITKQQSKEKSIRAYFNAYSGVTKALPIRFGECQPVILGWSKIVGESPSKAALCYRTAL